MTDFRSKGKGTSRKVFPVSKTSGKRHYIEAKVLNSENHPKMRAQLRKAEDIMREYDILFADYVSQITDADLKHFEWAEAIKVQMEGLSDSLKALGGMMTEATDGRHFSGDLDIITPRVIKDFREYYAEISGIMTTIAVLITAEEGTGKSKKTKNTTLESGIRLHDIYESVDELRHKLTPVMNAFFGEWREERKEIYKRVKKKSPVKWDKTDEGGLYLNVEGAHHGYAVRAMKEDVFGAPYSWFVERNGPYHHHTGGLSESLAEARIAAEDKYLELRKEVNEPEAVEVTISNPEAMSSPYRSPGQVHVTFRNMFDDNGNLIYRLVGA